MSAEKTNNPSQTSVSETAKKLHEDLWVSGQYDSVRLTHVFGDPRKSVTVESTKDTCAAYVARRRSHAII